MLFRRNAVHQSNRSRGQTLAALAAHERARSAGAPMSLPCARCPSLRCRRALLTGARSWAAVSRTGQPETVLSPLSSGCLLVYRVEPFNGRRFERLSADETQWGRRSPSGDSRWRCACSYAAVRGRAVFPGAVAFAMVLSHKGPRRPVSFVQPPICPCAEALIASAGLA